MSSTSAAERAETRLLQPIYNALDSRNVAAGLRACTQIIPRLRVKNVKHVAMAIKAHLLVLSKKRAEAAQLVDEIIRDPVDSEDALGYLRVTLTALERADDIGRLYESAFDRAPQNGSLGLQLCMAFVRRQDWPGVQKIAFRLHSLLEDDPRPYSWSIFAMLAQARATPAPKNLKLIYTLAQALLKTPAGHSTSSPSHIWLKVSVLLGLAETLDGEDETRVEVLREAWDFLESEEAKRMGGGNLEVDLVRWEVVKALGKSDASIWSSEWATLRSRIAGSEGTPAEDNFQLHLNLIALTGLLREKDDSLRSQAHSFFVELSECNAGNERGPWLALLHLGKELPSGDAASTEALQAYFRRFSGKPCLFEDLRPFLPTSATEAEPLRDFLRVDLEKEMTSLDDVRGRANALKILQHLSEPSDVAASDWIVDRCKGIYVQGLPFGSKLNADELQPVDDLVIIVVNILVSRWSQSTDPTHLIQAILLLEHAQKSSTMNHYFRLLLIRIYRLLAAPSLAKPCFQALKVDHVLHDTLSHFITTRTSTFAVGDGLASDPESLLARTGKGTAWFKQTVGADAEQLVVALSNEVYPQVADIGTYLRRLSTSLQRQVLQLEYSKQFLLVPTGEAYESATVKQTNVSLGKLPTGSLADNRDFKLVPSYQPGGAVEIETLLDAGPRVDASWVKQMRSTYSRVFHQAERLQGLERSPDQTSSSANGIQTPEDAGSLTIDEQALVAFATALLIWSDEASLASCKGQPSVDEIKRFFGEQSDRLSATLQDDQSPPWLALHHAAVALDGFALLKLLVKVLPSSKTRSATDPAGSALRSMAARLKQQAEKVGSAKTLKELRKTLPSLASAGVRDDLVVEVVVKLGASRREALNGLGKAILDVVAAA